MRLHALLMVLLLTSAIQAAERTKVTRHPNGTSGNITSVTVTATFYHYDDAGAGRQSYRLTWTETTAGVLSGSRILQVSSYPPTTWSTGINVTTTYASAWAPAFNASCAVEDPENASRYTTDSPLPGFPWDFAPPHDTLDWIWYTGRPPDPEEPGEYPEPWNPPIAADVYWPAIFDPPPSGSGSLTLLTEPAWGAAQANTVPTHCRGVKAFVRVENQPSPVNRRYISLVWDEVISTESCFRYYCTFTVGTDGTAWRIDALAGLRLPGVTGTFVYVDGRIVNLNAGTQGSTSLRPSLFPGASFGSGGGLILTDRALPPNTLQQNVTMYDYRAVIQRFLNAYLRDHGDATDVVAQAFQNTSPIAYYPAAPTGALPFDYTNTQTGNNAVPMFDRCDGEDGSDSGGGGGGSGTYTGPPASAFPSMPAPAGAGTRSAERDLSELPGHSFSTGFGLDIGSLASLSPTSQDPATVAFSIPWVDGTTQTFAFSSIPAADAPGGTALNSLRMLVRGILTVFIIWKFVGRAARDMVLY